MVMSHLSVFNDLKFSVVSRDVNCYFFLFGRRIILFVDFKDTPDNLSKRLFFDLSI